MDLLRGLVVAHVGHFDPAYSRNRIMAKALERAGAMVATITDPRPFLERTPRLARRLAGVRPDAVLVGFPGHADVPLARLAKLRNRAPVLLDAFVSLYETAVEDRRSHAPGSFGARRYALEDRVACDLATRVIVDTDAHIDYFVDHVGVPRHKLRRVWVGADDDVMRPGPPPDESPFRVFAYGTFLPLHGFEHVVRAASTLEDAGDDIRIDIVGSGPTEGAVRALAADLGVSSVRFLGRRPYADLPGLMAASHLCLGVFGTSGKAQRVIPNKVFDALAVARPVVTGDTPAAREVLTGGETAWLCAPGSSDAIARAITEAKADAGLRRRIAEQGHALFSRCFSIDSLARDVAGVVLEVLGRPAGEAIPRPARDEAS